MTDIPSSEKPIDRQQQYRPDPLRYPRSSLALLVLAGCALLSNAVVISRFTGWQPLRPVILYVPIFLAVRRRPTRRYGRLPVLPQGHFTDLVQRVSREMGLREPVTVLDASRRRRRGLRVDLWKGGPVLLASSHDVEVARLLPLGQEAVVRHELAHVANRDIALRELTISFRRAYISLSAVLVCLVVLRARTTAPAHEIDAMAPVLWRVVVTVMLVVTVTRAVLRTREYYADARSGAGASPEVRDALAEMLRRQSAPVPGDSGLRSLLAAARSVLRNHPEPRLRVRAFEAPDTLMRLAPWEFFLSGALAGMLLGAAGSAALALAPTVVAAASPVRAAVVSGLVAGVPLGLFLCLAVWRSCWYDLARSRNPRTASAALATAAGLLVGIPLAMPDTTSAVQSAAHGMSQLTDWRFELATVLGTLLVFRWLADTGAAMWRRARQSAAGPARSFRLQYWLAAVPATVVICWFLAFVQYWRLAEAEGRPAAGPTAFREFLLALPSTSVALLLTAMLPFMIHRSSGPLPESRSKGWKQLGNGGPPWRLPPCWSTPASGPRTFPGQRRAPAPDTFSYTSRSRCLHVSSHLVRTPLNEALTHCASRSSRVSPSPSSSLSREPPRTCRRPRSSRRNSGQSLRPPWAV